MKLDELEMRVEAWNQYFRIQGAFAHGGFDQGALAGGMPEPWKTYTLNSLVGRLRALVCFLKGDPDAIDRYEVEEFRAISQIRESQRLLKEALGEEKAEALDNTPLGREHPEEQERMKGLTFCMLTGIQDVQEARAYLKSMIGIPVELCVRCGKIFISTDKKKKYCSVICQKEKTDPARQAYRRVFIQYGRLIDGGLSAQKAEEVVRQTEPYASLVKQWSIPVKNWTKKRSK
jgi:hypothetical protein